MLVMNSLERAETGKVSTGVFQMLSVGNTGHPSSVGEAAKTGRITPQVRIMMKRKESRNVRLLNEFMNFKIESGLLHIV